MIIIIFFNKPWKKRNQIISKMNFRFKISIFQWKKISFFSFLQKKLEFLYLKNTLLDNFFSLLKKYSSK